jgi:hypothetical protein
VINVLDPDVIVLGGGVSNVDRLYARAAVMAIACVLGSRGDASAKPCTATERSPRRGGSGAVACADLNAAEAARLRLGPKEQAGRLQEEQSARCDDRHGRGSHRQ